MAYETWVSVIAPTSPLGIAMATQRRQFAEEGWAATIIISNRRIKSTKDSKARRTDALYSGLGDTTLTVNQSFDAPMNYCRCTESLVRLAEP